MSDSTLSRLGTVASLVVEKTSASKDLSKPYIGLEHIPSGGSSPVGSANSAESVSTNNIFREGDVLFGKLRPRLRKSVRAPFNGYCSTDILVLRPTAGTDPRFAAFVLGSDTVFQEAIRTEEGTKMPRCSWSTLKRLLIYCPEPGQCRRIGEILSAIDQAIEKTEALIEKYQQIKAGLMHDLFTRGIGPDGKLRPPREQAPELYQETPIGWIPGNWSLRPLANLTTKIVDGVHHTPNYVEHGVPFVTVRNLTGSTSIDFENVSYIDAKTHAECYSRADPMPGDVLVSKDGTLGCCRIVYEDMPEFSIFVSVAMLRVSQELTAEWLHFFFDSDQYLKQLGYLSAGTGLKHIHLEHFRKFQIALPNLEEQNELNERVRIVSNRLNHERKRLLKLRYEKSGLMHDLLTGKVPVKPDPPESPHV